MDAGEFPTTVIIGAGPAGMRCAERLAEAGLRVVLIGAEASPPYDRVALSRWLADEIAECELVTHNTARLAALGIVWHGGTRVAGIDAARHEVVTADGAVIRYDTLVLATGSQAIRLALPGADLDGVLLYRTLDDVRAMIAAAGNGGRAIVIGGGLLGLEAAAGLAARGMAVTVLHAVDRLMERQLDQRAARRLAGHLAARGITVIENASSSTILGETGVRGVTLDDGRVMAADLVVMAVGIRPEASLARAAGLTVGRGIVVDGQMRSSQNDIFAIGECAEHQGQCVGLVLPALAQAEIAARAICGEAATYQPATDSAALKVAGAPVWSAGLVECADGEQITLDDPDGAYRRLLVRQDRLVGALLFGETADAPWYMRLIRECAPIGALRETLPFGPAYQEATP
jgi:nitrite reductase (NADH) large subunit